MKNQKKRTGIIAAGNWIVDDVKLIDKFPEEQSLSNIISEFSSNGGSAYNILVGLFKLNAPFQLEAIGLVGNDLNGNIILDQCKTLNINIDQLHVTSEAPTSYTIVTSAKSTGKRTFFHHRGANSCLGPEHFDLKLSNAKILHLGYLLLLDKLDEKTNDGETNAAKVLKEANELGFITTVDLVSEDSERFTEIIPSSLPFVDILFLNELEASKLSGIDIRDDASIQQMDTLGEDVFQQIFKMGVRQWIILHRPEGVWAAHRSGERIFQASLCLAQDQIVGANGAGDALAAGILYGIHENWEMEKSLLLGVSAAATSLSSVTCSDGIRQAMDCLEMAKIAEFKS
ncbi:carbohydrate kinase family protein [Sphingobacterium sp. HJSM2_6]|uniref:carbohydrate kinase family protein n=1 Tax=Sphingobacterium sp. HJSM2_6 TaxID=3366264 RepID=UPI003BD9C600